MDVETIIQIVAATVLVICTGILIEFDYLEGKGKSGFLSGLINENINAGDCLEALISLVNHEGAQLYVLFVAFCCSLVRFCSDAYFYALCVLAFFGYTFVFMALQAPESVFITSQQLFWGLTIANLLAFLIGTFIDCDYMIRLTFRGNSAYRKINMRMERFLRALPPMA